MQKLVLLAAFCANGAFAKEKGHVENALEEFKNSCKDAEYAIKDTSAGNGLLLAKPLGYTCILADVFEKGPAGIGGALQSTGVPVALPKSLDSFGNPDNDVQADFKVKELVEILRNAEADETDDWTEGMKMYVSKMAGSQEVLSRSDLASALRKNLTRSTKNFRGATPVLPKAFGLKQIVGDDGMKIMSGWSAEELGQVPAAVNDAAHELRRVEGQSELPFGLPDGFNGLNPTGKQAASHAGDNAPLQRLTYRRDSEFVFPDMRD